MTLQEVITAGYDMMLWPSDDATDYEDFTSCFQYISRKVDYGNKSHEHNVEELSTADLQNRMTNGTIFLAGETGDHIEARFCDQRYLRAINDGHAVKTESVVRIVPG